MSNAVTTATVTVTPKSAVRPRENSRMATERRSERGRATVPRCTNSPDSQRFFTKSPRSVSPVTRALTSRKTDPF